MEPECKPQPDEQLQLTREMLTRLEKEYLEQSSPNQFIMYAIEMKRIPPKSFIAFTEEWGPRH